jgi:hypothetical protein
MRRVSTSTPASLFLHPPSFLPHPQPRGLPKKDHKPSASTLIHTTKAAVEWSRTVRHQRCSVLARPHLTDFLASFWNSSTDLCVSHVCWHCVACIALPQADANTFSSSSAWRTAGTWRRTSCTLRCWRMPSGRKHNLSSRHTVTTRLAARVQLELWAWTWTWNRLTTASSYCFCQRRLAASRFVSALPGLNPYWTRLPLSIILEPCCRKF